MKFKGQEIKNDNVEYVAIPRNGFDIIFIARPILDFTRFETLCPVPKPPTITPRNGEPYPDISDEKFLARLQEYNEAKTAWLILESLKTSPDITWETIKDDDPKTWVGWQKELTDAEFNSREIMQITSAVAKVNSLDDDQLEAARQRFLASLVVVEN